MMPALLEAFPLPASAAEALRAGLASVDSAARRGVGADRPGFPAQHHPDQRDRRGGRGQGAAAGRVHRHLRLRRDPDRAPKSGRRSAASSRASRMRCWWWSAGCCGWRPVGVLGLAFAVGAGAGGAAFGAVLHYIVLVSADRHHRDARCLRRRDHASRGWRLGDFARAMIAAAGGGDLDPVVLASLPAMLDASRMLRRAAAQRRRHPAAGGGAVPRDRAGDERRGGYLCRPLDGRSSLTPAI